MIRVPVPNNEKAATYAAFNGERYIVLNEQQRAAFVAAMVSGLLSPLAAIACEPLEVEHEKST